MHALRLLLLLLPLALVAGETAPAPPTVLTVSPASLALGDLVTLAPVSRTLTVAVLTEQVSLHRVVCGCPCVRVETTPALPATLARGEVVRALVTFHPDRGEPVVHKVVYVEAQLPDGTALLYPVPLTARIVPAPPTPNPGER